MTALLTILLGTAHAGPLGNWCARQLEAWNIVADDPYQYEIARLEIREAWRRLRDHEKSTLQILRYEMKRRTYGP